MNNQFPNTDAEIAAMPPPPPRPRTSTLEPSLSSIPLVAAPTTAVVHANDSSLATIGGLSLHGNVNTNSNTKRPASRRLSEQNGYPPRPPPAKRTCLGIVRETTDKENTINNADNVESDDDDEEEDELVYSGPLSDPEGDDDDEKKSKESAMAEIDSMMKMGLQAFQDRERLQQENTFLRDDNVAKTSELSRLRAALKQKQEIITVRFCLVHCRPSSAAAVATFRCHGTPYK